MMASVGQTTAQAGARRVIGIDCSSILDKAKIIVAANGLADTSSRPGRSASPPTWCAAPDTNTTPPPCVALAR